MHSRESRARLCSYGLTSGALLMIARGRIPEEEPRFFSGDFGGGSNIGS
jgi:hypothetical protein